MHDDDGSDVLFDEDDPNDPYDPVADHDDASVDDGVNDPEIYDFANDGIADVAAYPPMAVDEGGDRALPLPAAGDENENEKRSEPQWTGG